MVLTTVSVRYPYGTLPTGLIPSSPSQAKNHVYLFILQPNKYGILSCKVGLTQQWSLCLPGGPEWSVLP